MNNNAAYWIKALGLEKHPEGGFFKETYRSNSNIGPCCLPFEAQGSRSTSTAIYYLLRSDEVSVFHRIQSDEIWHHYTGSSLTLHYFDSENTHQTVSLGKDPSQGEIPQAVIPAGLWFGAAVNHPDTYALVGCTVSPGFDFADFKIGKREDLLKQYPAYQNIIYKMTREN